MDPGFAIGIGVLWVILNLLGRKKRSPDVRPRPRSLPPPADLSTVTGQDATQQEGMRLQDLMRELGKTLEKASTAQRQPPAARAPSTTVGRPPPVKRVPAPANTEEGGSLETDAEVHSLEEEVRRPQRADIDSDDEAEAIVARRIAAAEANARALGAADHRSFDARIRQQPADATSTRAYSVKRLRHAVVWREILGPPVSLRDTDDR